MEGIPCFFLSKIPLWGLPGNYLPGKTTPRFCFLVQKQQMNLYSELRKQAAELDQ
jgi:hypothetical protein